ncbi:MAG: hypothetical protein HY000_12595, partial [Planctomycetes bacterium]|nr:hypothetical protein [Planctomycetota bacterium]
MFNSRSRRRDSNHSRPSRRRPFAVISDLLFNHKARRRRAANRRSLLEPLEDRRMLTMVEVLSEDQYTHELAVDPGALASFKIKPVGEFTFLEEDLEVQFTIGGEATEGDDYQTLPRTATIPAGQDTYVLVTVVPIHDWEIEPTELVSLELSDGDDYDPVPGAAGIYIYNADIALGVGDGELLEGTGDTWSVQWAITFTDNEGYFAGDTIRVHWATSPAADKPVELRATPQALPGELGDYISSGSTEALTFTAPGTQYVYVPIVADAVDEFDEIFYIDITSAGAEDSEYAWPLVPPPGDDARGEVTILDDEGPTVVNLEGAPDTLRPCTCTCGCGADDAPKDDPQFYLFGNNVQRAGGLVYSSGQNPHPFVTLTGSLTEKVPAPDIDDFDVRLRLKDPNGQGYVGDIQLNYGNDGLEPGDGVRFSMLIDGTSLPTGRYEFDVTVTTNFVNRPSTEDIFDDAGYVIVVNRSDNQYGPTRFSAGWWLDGLDRLYSQSDGVLLVDAAGGASFFEGQGPGYALDLHDQRTVASFAFSGGVYTLTYHDGSKSLFSSDYLLTARFDRNGNETQFIYQTGTDKLITIRDDVSGRETSLSYHMTTGDIESITDFASRTTDFLFDQNGRLTTVLEPETGAGRPTVVFGYSGSLIESVTDERNVQTGYEYGGDLRLESMTYPNPQGGGTFTVPFKSVQSGGLEAGVKITGPRLGSYTEPTDPTFRTFTFSTDRFGGITLWRTPENNETIREFDALGRLEKLIEPDPDGPNGPRGQEETFYAYHSTFQDKVTQLTYVVDDGPDIVHTWTYETNAQVTSYTDPESRVTSYTLDSKGNVLTMTEEGAAGTADDLVTRYAYTLGGSGIDAGMVASVTDPRGETTFRSYYTDVEGTWRAGRLKQIVHADTAPQGRRHALLAHRDRRRRWRLRHLRRLDDRHRRPQR